VSGGDEMASEVRTTTVHIHGHEYRVRTEESPEFVRDVALFVDETMRQIAGRMNTGTSVQVAVLAALNIAEELFRERRDGNGAASREIESRMKAVLERLDEVAAPEKGPRARRAARTGSRG